MKTCRHCGAAYVRSWAKSSSYLPACECAGHARPDALVQEGLRYEADVAAQMITSMGGVTLEMIGETMGLTRERVRQIEERALKRMRARLKLAGIGESDLARVLAERRGPEAARSADPSKASR